MEEDYVYHLKKDICQIQMFSMLKLTYNLLNDLDHVYGYSVWGMG